MTPIPHEKACNSASKKLRSIVFLFCYRNPYFLKISAARRIVINLHIRPRSFVVTGGRQPLAVRPVIHIENLRTHVFGHIAAEHSPSKLWNICHTEACDIDIRLASLIRINRFMTLFRDNLIFFEQGQASSYRLIGIVPLLCPETIPYTLPLHPAETLYQS